MQPVCSPGTRDMQGKNGRLAPDRSRTLRAVPPQPPGGGSEPRAGPRLRRAVRHRRAGMAGHRHAWRLRAGARSGYRAVDPHAQVDGESRRGAVDGARLDRAHRQCRRSPRGAARPHSGRRRCVRTARADRARLPGPSARGADRERTTHPRPPARQAGAPARPALPPGAARVAWARDRSAWTEPASVAPGS
jgi:hypothetical protein